MSNTEELIRWVEPAGLEMYGDQFTYRVAYCRKKDCQMQLVRNPNLLLQNLSSGTEYTVTVVACIHKCQSCSAPANMTFSTMKHGKFRCRWEPDLNQKP